jgi:hypothetical protein
MSWNHLVLEGHCIYESEEYLDVPCCDTKPGLVSIDCLYDANNQKCPYFGCTRARSCIVLTDDNGLDVACDTFWAEEPANSKLFHEESNWIDAWKKLIKDNKKTT